jgi:hypothetical protein
MTAIAERVAAGAAFLDERVPDWWRADRASAIDPDGLMIQSYCDCVLGQLFGTYGTGVVQLDLWDTSRTALGFFTDDPPRETDVLEAEWKRLITERRAAA